MSDVDNPFVQAIVQHKRLREQQVRDIARIRPALIKQLHECFAAFNLSDQLAAHAAANIAIDCYHASFVFFRILILGENTFDLIDNRLYGYRHHNLTLARLHTEVARLLTDRFPDNTDRGN